MSIGRVVAGVINYALAHWFSVIQSDEIPVNVTCLPPTERQVWEAPWRDLAMVEAGKCSEVLVRVMVARYGKAGGN